MPHTYFADFLRDDGSPITVEYSFAGGSDTTYSPLSGASGGDGCEVEIVSVMPNTPEYEEVCRQRLELGAHIVSLSGEERALLQELDQSAEIMRKRCALTDAENERMCEWIAEHHVVEDDESDWRF